MKIIDILFVKYQRSSYICLRLLAQYTTSKLKSQEIMKTKVFTPGEIKRKERDEKVVKACKALFANPENKKMAVWNEVAKEFDLTPFYVTTIYRRVYGKSR